MTKTIDTKVRKRRRNDAVSQGEFQGGEDTTEYRELTPAQWIAELKAKSLSDAK